MDDAWPALPIVEAADSSATTAPSYLANGAAFTRRVRGSVTAPLSGLYSFWISSDDGSRLYLSDEGTKYHLRDIADVSGWTSPGSCDEQPGQRSHTVYLAAEESRFLQFIHANSGGPGHAAVSWSVAPAYPASFAIDGRYDTFAHSQDVSGSSFTADLGADRPIDVVELINGQRPGKSGCGGGG